MTAPQLFHAPVLEKEVLTDLFFDGVQTVFDGTLGLGGHAERILTEFPDLKRYCGSDLDQQHLDYAQNRLQNWSAKIDTHQGNYSQMEEFLGIKDIPRPLVVLLDLGICSHHVDNPDKILSDIHSFLLLRCSMFLPRKLLDLMISEMQRLFVKVKL